MAGLDLLMASVLMLSGGDPGPVATRPFPAGEESRKVEEDYARREQDSGSLEEFRGGDTLEGLVFLGLLAVSAVVVLLYFGIVALAKAAS